MRAGSIDWRMAPEEFVAALSALSADIRRMVQPGAAGRRHARDVVRRRRRWYMRLRGLSALPSIEGQSSHGGSWIVPSASGVRIVVPARPDALAGSTPDAASTTDARKAMRRLMHDAGEALGRTALVTARQRRRRLPSIAVPRHATGASELRALYLDRLGVALMPELTDEQVLALEDAGAMVVANEFVVVGDPAETSGAAAAAGASQPDHLRSIGLKPDDADRPTGAGVLIGVLDSGIDPRHPEFDGKSIVYMGFKPTGERRRDGPRDFGSHGTHVAALCVGRTVGVAPGADLAVAAVLTSTTPEGLSGGFTAQILAGMNWLAGAGQLPRPVDLLNASFGGPGSAPIYRLPVATYRLGGTLLVAAIGNRGRSGFGHHSAPAMLDTTLAVGAVDDAGVVADFSDWGDCFCDAGVAATCKPDIVAPGVAVRSAVPGGAYARMDGTSMACPIVTGAAALLIEDDEGLRRDPDALSEAILALASPLPDQGRGYDARRGGRGRLDLSSIQGRGRGSPTPPLQG